MGKRNFNVFKLTKDLRKPFNTFNYIQLKFKEENICNENM